MEAMEQIGNLRADLAALAEVERNKTRVLVRRANVALVILIVVGICMVIAGLQAVDAARSNGQVLDRLDEGFNDLVCYAAVLGQEPPPPGAVCPG